MTDSLHPPLEEDDEPTYSGPPPEPEPVNTPPEPVEDRHTGNGRAALATVDPFAESRRMSNPYFRPASGDPLFERGLPTNLECERAILGAILLENGLCHDVQAYTPDPRTLFFLDSNRRILDKMILLTEKSSPIDLTTLTNELRRVQEFEQIGGATYIASLIDGVPRTDTVEHYLDILSEKTALRTEIQIGGELTAAAFEEELTSVTIAEQIQQKLFRIIDGRRNGPRLVSLEDSIWETVELLEQRSQNPSMVTGVPSGLTDLDALTAGWQNQDLIYMAARPSQGKTALALNLADYAADQGVVVAVFSMEMNRRLLLERQLSSNARVDAHRIRTGYLNREEWAKLADAARRMSTRKIYYNDTSNMTVVGAHSLLRQLKARVGCGLAIFDYVQLFDSASQRKEMNRQQEITLISRQLKAMAKDCDLPVIALSQLSRSSEQRRGHEPRLSDLRESGSLEQDADVVVFIHREEMYEPSDENRGIAELIVAKQRNGPVGRVQTAFLKEFGRFENMWRE